MMAIMNHSEDARVRSAVLEKMKKQHLFFVNVPFSLKSPGGEKELIQILILFSPEEASVFTFSYSKMVKIGQ